MLGCWDKVSFRLRVRASIGKFVRSEAGSRNSIWLSTLNLTVLIYESPLNFDYFSNLIPNLCKLSLHYFHSLAFCLDFSSYFGDISLLCCWPELYIVDIGYQCIFVSWHQSRCLCRAVNTRSKSGFPRMNVWKISLSNRKGLSAILRQK